MARPRRKNVLTTRFTFQGQKRKVRIRIPQSPYRPLKVVRRSGIKQGALRPDVPWHTVHRRGIRRIKIGEDPLEARAVSKEYIRGTLPERIIYKYLVSILRLSPTSDFDFQCLHKDHKILTDDLRWVPLHTLKKGDGLLAFDEFPIDPATGVSNRYTMKRNYKRSHVLESLPGVEECKKIILSDETEIIATNEHPWLIYGRRGGLDGTSLYKSTGYAWAKTDELREGMELPKYFDVWDTNELQYLSGFFDADGNICHKIKKGRENGLVVSFGQSEGPTLDFLLQQLQDMKINFSVSLPDNTKSERSVYHIVIRGGRSESLKFLGILQPVKLDYQLDVNRLGRLDRKEVVSIISIEDIGKQDIIRLETTSKTYFGEGFGMHNSSLAGGRMELGGMVADFMFYRLKMIIQVQGPTHGGFLRSRKDDEQQSILMDMGYDVVELEEKLIYSEYLLERKMSRIFNLSRSGGASQAFMVGNSEPEMGSSQDDLIMFKIQNIQDELSSIQVKLS